MSDNYKEETAPLFKMLRTEAFRFVVVRYSHGQDVRNLEQELRTRFPDRPFLKMDAQKISYQDFSKAYSELGRGFCWLENFDDALKEERDSLGKETEIMAENNERRRHITAGLNLRRDRLALSPVALFVLVPNTVDPLFARSLMEKMPDLWSFRSMLMNFKQQQTAVSDSPRLETMLESYKSPIEVEKPKKELGQLLLRLENSPEDEIAYRLTLYPQIVAAAKAAGEYNQALSILDAWEKQSADDAGKIWLERGDVLSTIGQLEAALNCFEKALAFYEHETDHYDKSVSLERIGQVNLRLGNLNKALTSFEEGSRLRDELYQSNPQNTNFKNVLAISYSKLGETHFALGNLDQALTFFEQNRQLAKELHESYPQNEEFKLNYCWANQFLGMIYSDLGELSHALEFFNIMSSLFEELYMDNPQNVTFKEGLAIAYEKLGETHSYLGNLDKALSFFELDTKLSKELCSSYPQNVTFKEGLAISFEKLGNTHNALGNLDQALTYFEQNHKLEKELYADYPQNVSFKNGLAVSYFKLGEFNKINLKDQNKAKAYLQQAETLWKELVRDAPGYTQYQKFLNIVQKDLSELP